MKSKGFTLIELMVVIGVIGLLSAVVVGALSSTRVKGKEAAIKQMAAQMKTLLELNRNDFGDYNNLRTNSWITSAAACAGVFAGTHAAKAREICVAIINNEVSTTPYGTNYLFIGDENFNINKYSIMVILPKTGEYLCLGSNNKMSIGGPYWSASGCYSDTTL